MYSAVTRSQWSQALWYACWSGSGASERQVTIYQFERTSSISYDDHLARFTFRVKCVRDLYRTLSVDLGEKLGYAAHMSHLTRTSAAGLQLEDALTLDEIAEKWRLVNWTFSILLKLERGILSKFS